MAETRPRHHLDPEPARPAAPVRQWPHARDDCDDCGERDADLEATWRGYSGTPPRWCSSCAGRSIADLAAGVGQVLVRPVDPDDEGRAAGAPAPAVPQGRVLARHAPTPPRPIEQGAPCTVNGAPVTVHRSPTPAGVEDQADDPAAGAAARDDRTRPALATAVVEALAARPSDGVDRMLTPSEVAAGLRVNVNTIRRWCADGTLPALKVGSRVRVLESELRAFVERRES